MHHKGRKSITILEIMKTMVKDMVKLPIFLGKEIFLDFPIIKEVLVIEEEVVLVVLMVMEDIGIITPQC